MSETNDRAARRVMGCGYCGAEITRYDGAEMPPPAEELKRMLTAFVAHDATCPNNPLAARLAEAEKVVDGLMRGDCWCELGVDNPSVTSHAPQCDRARAWRR